MNWGWYERYNGWFEFGAFTVYPNGETWNFNGGGNEMVINVYPYDGYDIPGGELQNGDVNKDGIVNITDVTALIDYLLSNDASAIDLEAANVNGDNTVSITDVSALIDILLSNSPAK